MEIRAGVGSISRTALSRVRIGLPVAPVPVPAGAVVALCAMLVLALSGSARASLVRGKDVPLTVEPNDAVAADFNGGGQMDLAIADPRGVLILKGRGDGTFKRTRRFAAGGSAGRAAVADLNRDGDRDLLVTNFTADRISVLLGRGDGTFKRAHSYRTGDAPTYIAIGRLNRDRYPDLAVTNISGNDVSILINRGDGTFKRRVNLVAGYEPRSVAITDLDGNGKQDLVVSDFEKLEVRMGRGDGTFKRRRGISMRLALSELLAGDFNRDGAPDIAVSNSAYNAAQGVHVLFGRGNGRFRGNEHYAFDSAATKIADADMNGERRKDLVVETEGYPFGLGGSDQGYLFVMRGHRDGSFTREDTLHLGAEGGRFAIGDFNGDHNRDVAAIVYASSPKLELFLGE